MNVEQYRMFLGSTFVDGDEYVYVDEGEYNHSLDEGECDIFTRLAVRVDDAPDDDGFYPCYKLVLNASTDEEGAVDLGDAAPEVYDADCHFDADSGRVIWA